MRSFIIRQRNRRMMNLAIRNGTYVPPTPAAAAGATATRHANTHVDLSKKPQLWEANLGGGGGGWQQQPGSFGLNWKSEYSRDWESIKPIYAGYTENSVPHSGYSTPTNLTGVSPPPISTPINPSGRSRRNGDDENRGTTASTTPSLFTRARLFLNPNPTTTILGSSSSSSADNGTNLNSHTISTNTVTATTTSISMTELSSSDPPPKIRVAVLIAMPSPLSTHGSSSTTPPTALPSSKAQPITNSELHPLGLSSYPKLKVADEEKLELKNEEPLTIPHLEMGVADVQVVLSRSRKDSESSSSRSLREEEKISSSIIHSRGSSYAE